MSEYPIPSLDRLLAHRRWVQGVARRLLRDEQAAEDLAQEAWLRALRSPPDPERDPKPWLRRVLKNLASNARRGQGRRRSHETEWRESREQRSPEALVADAEQHQRLVNLLMDLEEPGKTALVLRYYEGLGPKEIADRLGVPEGTVHSRLARAVERLKSRLDQEEKGNRRAWIAGLLPLARFDHCAPAAAASATTLSLPGILAMTFSKPKIALLAALLVGCLLSAGIWLVADSRGADRGTEEALLPIPRVSDPTLRGRREARVDPPESDIGPGGAAASGLASGATRVVSGIVRDADGNPVSDAEVFVLPEGSPGLDEAHFPPPPFGRVRTTPDGRFAVNLRGETGSGRLLAFAPGHTAGSILLRDREAGAPVDVALGEPWRVRVRVTDADGIWPDDCTVDLVDEADDVLDRAVDPRRQELYVELAAPERGNEQEVALHRAGSAWLIAYAPPGMAAVPAKTEILQPTDEVAIRLFRSAKLTVHLLDASTNRPLGADVEVSGWMGRRSEDMTAWSFESRGPTQHQDSNIPPQSYELEFESPEYEKWTGNLTFRAEGEAHTLDVRLVPTRPDVGKGRLFLTLSQGEEASDALRAYARLNGRVRPPTSRYRIFARLQAGDLEAWRSAWGARGGWAPLALTAREDGTIEVQQALYPLDDPHLPAGTYDLYVTEWETGRAAFMSGVRVFGDQENRYEVRPEPGTMFAVADLLPDDEDFTRLDVRTEEAGSLPLVTLYAQGSDVFHTSESYEYLLRRPRKPIRLGPFPGTEVEVRAIDQEQRTRSFVVRGAGEVVR